MTITDGDDVTNPDCIAWFQANAVLLSGGEESSSLLTVTYNNKIIKEMSDYGTFTLNTKGKFCQYDIMLSFPEPAVNLISFTIEGVEYQAEEGMTWGEWIESEYNTDGFYATASHIGLTSWGRGYVGYPDLFGHYAYIDENIINNTAYRCDYEPE